MSERAHPDIAQIAEIYDTYHGKVVAYATKLLGRGEAEDVAQEVFIKVDRSIGALADPAKLSAWIYAITLNTVRDLARKRSVATAPATLGDRLQAGALEAQEDALSKVADLVTRDPQEAAIRKEMVSCYVDYVRQLPPKLRAVYLLSEFEDLPNIEIAQRLSLSLAAVKIRLHRARAKLNDELRRNCRCYTNERGELMGAPKS